MNKIELKIIGVLYQGDADPCIRAKHLVTTKYVIAVLYLFAYLL